MSLSEHEVCMDEPMLPAHPAFMGIERGCGRFAPMWEVCITSRQGYTQYSLPEEKTE